MALFDEAREQGRGDGIRQVADDEELAGVVLEGDGVEVGLEESASSTCTLDQPPSSSRRSAAKPRSRSTAMTRRRAAPRSPGGAPARGPISTTTRSAERWHSSTMRSATAGRTRKFWPQRLRGLTP